MMLRSALAGLALLLPFSGAFTGCQVEDQGTEIPNELVGREFLAGTGAAPGAEVLLVPVGYLPGDTGRTDTALGLVLKGVTRGDGRFAFRDVPAGIYNILASKDGMASFRDSVTVTGKSQDLASDTLRQPETLKGRVVLQPHHDPRSATVQILGTLRYVNADKDGSFAFEGLGAGTYRLRASTSLPDYSPVYREAATQPKTGNDTTLVLRPFYFGIPVVTGITAVPGPGGTVVLRWSKPDFDKVRAYCIYRDTAGTLLPTASPLQCVPDTLYIDTLYSPTPRPGQHPWQDTAYHGYSYRVKILDQSGDTGPSFGFADVRAVPPSIGVSSGLWSRAMVTAPFGARADHSMLVFKDRLWILGGNAADSLDVWSSPDGLEWKRELARAPFASRCKAVVHKDMIWALGSVENPSAPALEQVRNFLWNSPDGIHWTKVTDSIPMPGRRWPQFAAQGGRLFILAGEIISPMYAKEAWSSEDGIAWIQSPSEVHAHRAGVAPFLGRLWLLGGGSTLEGNHQLENRSTQDGLQWRSEPVATGMLPRMYPTAAEHNGDLWMIGGVTVDSAFRQTPRQDAWKSPDGRSWTRVDALTPFEARIGQALASFRGRLWLVGGTAWSSQTSLADIWYLE